MTLFQYFAPDNFAWFLRDIFVYSLRGFNAILMGNKFCWVPCICPSGHFSALDFVAFANGNLQTLRNWFMSLSLSLTHAHARPPRRHTHTHTPAQTHSQWVYITCLHEGIPPAPPQLISLETLHFQKTCVLSFFFLFLAAEVCAVWPHLKALAPQKNNFLHDGLGSTTWHHLSLFSASKRTRGQCVLQLFETKAVNVSFFFLCQYAPCTNAIYSCFMCFLYILYTISFILFHFITFFYLWFSFWS